MTRCSICNRRIWPWQHYGWRVTLYGTTRFHAKHPVAGRPR